MSLFDECRGRAEQALAVLSGGASPAPRCEMKLRAALGASLNYTKGTVPEVEAAYRKALELAEKIADAEYQLRSLRGLWTFHLSNGNHHVALELAQRISSLAADRSDPNDRLMGDRLIGISQHYLGDQASARSYLERALAHSPTLGRRSHVRFQLDQRVSARVHLARTLWLQGLVDQAMHAAESSPEDARVTNHANSLCYALAVAACPITLWVGDLDAAEHYIGTLLGHSARHGLMIWRALGQSYQGQLAIQRGEVTAGLRLLRAGFDEIDEAGPASRRLIELLMAEVSTPERKCINGPE